MRLTDNRYSGERSQFELALRMIRHEARTRTIRECTGLSDDRIRKLYTTYFRNGGTSGVKRRRGKSPRQINRFVKNSQNQIQATTLVALFSAGLLVRIDQHDRVHPCWPRPGVEFGHRLCRAYETYLLLHKEPQLSFDSMFRRPMPLIAESALLARSSVAYISALQWPDGRSQRIRRSIRRSQWRNAKGCGLA